MSEGEKWVTIRWEVTYFPCPKCGTLHTDAMQAAWHCQPQAMVLA